ncbi:tripartite tricarboxylate transporter substrate binding protein [Cupriavidus alkaliphilus]|uniref:tripartite tricarboxylate transporter substrate binding protein n=1 Tax=Cupriavidus alkaliphilus TaxID=942866 RepID=UPI001614F54E|nr:tripartite tricarboxylate transporter substrate binding protein [Cupriavidus alkaliphilus]MBB3014050.1 tripartite-type tricarboxylate transporter receptor subunit TctC [Cupriavidus alkaliphilus]
MHHPISLSRRAVFAAGVSAVAAALLPKQARARASWPDKPIKMIVPFGPGASTDTIARYIAGKLSQRLDQQVVVENKVGAGGIVGTNFVALQPADGYTLLFQSSPYVTAPLMGGASKKHVYDPTKDLQAVGMVGAAPFMIVVGNEVQAKSLRELINLARTKPHSINYGSSGVGTFNHLGGELLGITANIKLVHVPYTGFGPVMTDFLGGRLQMLVATFPAALSYVRAGKIRALAVTGAQRSPLMPELPTMSEAGVPGYELEGWWGLLSPPGLPASILKRLNDELNAILAMPDTIKLLAHDGATPRPGSPEHFTNLIRREDARWRKVIHDAQLSTE